MSAALVLHPLYTGRADAAACTRASYQTRAALPHKSAARRDARGLGVVRVHTMKEAAQYQPKGCSTKMPPSCCSISSGRLLEHPFLENLCLDHFSVNQGKFHRVRFGYDSCTGWVERFQFLVQLRFLRGFLCVNLQCLAEGPSASFGS